MVNKRWRAAHDFHFNFQTQNQEIVLNKKKKKKKKMVFNGVMLVSAVRSSAEAWQYLACYGEDERIDGQQMVDLALCFPLHQLGRLLLYIWTFLCVPPHTYYPDHYAASSSSSSSSSDDADGDGDGDGSSSSYRYVYYHQPSLDDDYDDASSLDSDC